MRVVHVGIALLLAGPGWAGDPIPGVDFYLFRPSDPVYTTCMNASRRETVSIRGKRYCMLPGSVVSSTRMKGDFSRSVGLTPLPGPIFQTPEECTDLPGSRVVVVNGVRFCMGPASAISHNSSRSNFSR